MGIALTIEQTGKMFQQYRVFLYMNIKYSVYLFISSLIYFIRACNFPHKDPIHILFLVQI